MRRFLWLIPLIAVVAAIGSGVFGNSASRIPGNNAPEFSLETLNGTAQATYGTKDLRGSFAVINFWASWCVPCATEAPLLNAEASTRPNVAFLGVNFLDGRREAKRFIAEHEIIYPNVRDADGAISKRKYKLTGAPETFFLHRSGRIAGVWIGELFKEELARLLNNLEDLEPGESLDVTGRGETRKIP